ncbi:Fic family protein [bacterium]|nr:Fic family protein [bacterium]
MDNYNKYHSQTEGFLGFYYPLKPFEELARKYLLEYSLLAELPLLPKFKRDFEAELVTDLVYFNLALSSNLTPRDQVEQIISSGPTSSLLIPSEIAARNLKAGYQFILDLQVSEAPYELTEIIIKMLHYSLTKDLDIKASNPGKYREHYIKVEDHQGNVFIPPKSINEIRPLMVDYIQWINSPMIVGQPFLVRPALAHYFLGLIHPFGDANGRMGRFIEAALLHTKGIKYLPFMLSEYYYQHIDDYYLAFSQSINDKDKEVTGFLEFIFGGFEWCLERLKGLIYDYLHQQLLTSYFDSLFKSRVINQRQYDLVMLWYQNRGSFSPEQIILVSPFNLLYRRMSKRTLHRDLKTLVDLNLLLCEGSKYRINADLKL